MPIKNKKDLSKHPLSEKGQGTKVIRRWDARR